MQQGSIYNQLRREGQAQRLIRRWEKLFTKDIVYKLVEEELKRTRSKGKAKVFREWIACSIDPIPYTYRLIVQGFPVEYLASSRPILKEIQREASGCTMSIEWFGEYPELSPASRNILSDGFPADNTEETIYYPVDHAPVNPPPYTAIQMKDGTAYNYPVDHAPSLKEFMVTPGGCVEMTLVFDAGVDVL
jgi:hypothetical protein